MYAVRVRVPNALRARVGKREIWKSLGTSDYAIAKRAKLSVLDQILAQFEDLRHVPQPTSEDLEQIARDHYRAELESDARERRSSGPGHLATTAFNELFVGPFLKELRIHAANGTRVLVEDVAEDHLRTRGFDFAEKAPAFVHLCQLITRAEIEIARRKLERDTGDFSGLPIDPVLIEPAKMSSAGGSLEGRLPLSRLLARMHAEKVNIAEATKAEHISIVEAFEDFIGHRIAAGAITKQQVIDFKQMLLRTPRNRSMLFPGRTLAESVRLNEARTNPHPVLNPKTIGGKYLGHLKSILNWAVADGIVETNVAEKVGIAPGKRKKKTRHPFHSEEFKQIFGSQIFAGRGERSARFWAILIAALNGLRASEIGQLEPSDIVQQRGIWCFRITDFSSSGAATEQKRLKTGELGRRHVPLHPSLISIGLVAHADRARQAKHSRLFPDWKPNAKGDYSQGVPRWFNRTFLGSVGLRRPGLVFHSFRHSFKDAARSAGIPQEIHDYLTGHAASGVSGGYGEGSSVEGLQKAISRIELPVDLSSLHI